MIRSLLANWRTGRAISRTKRSLAALLREYDKVCSDPGETTAFTANRMHELGCQIAMIRHKLRTLDQEGFP